jgi:uncharacterized membrane protein
MLELAIAAIFFLALHRLIAGTRLRDRLMARIGERAYLGLFSFASALGILWLGSAYSRAYGDTNPLLWTAPPGLAHSGLIVVLLAVMLAVHGLVTPSPTAVAGSRRLAEREPARGVLRITRHPFLWGVIIWSSFHLVANGDLASVILFGSLLLLAVTGTWSIDRKRARAHGQAWARFARVSSNIPFAAIVRGRNRLAVRELGLGAWALGLAIYSALLLAHPFLFGATPFPGGWVPAWPG